MGFVEMCVPQETVSDEAVVIGQWHVEPGQRVDAGTVVVTVEASKGIFDVETEQEGFVFYCHEAGDEVGVGSVLAVITDTREFDYDEYLSATAQDDASAPGDESEKADAPAGVRFSKAAERLLGEHEIALSVFEGMGLVREDDVMEALRDQGTGKPAASSELHWPTGEKVILIGGGGHAKMCIDIMRQQQALQIVGLLDDGIDQGEEVLGVPVLGPLSLMSELREDGIMLAVNAIGAASNHPFRTEIYERIKAAGFLVPNIVHPNATVEPSAIVGEGNQIMAGAIVGSAVSIGHNCIINSGSVISHDSVLADNVHIAPGAILAGGVRVGRDSLVGMGVTVYLGVEIGERVVIMNGESVFSDVPSGSICGRRS